MSSFQNFLSKSVHLGWNVCKHWTLLPPANVVCEGYVFTPVCDSVNRGGGVRGFIRGLRGFI